MSDFVIVGRPAVDSDTNPDAIVDSASDGGSVPYGTETVWAGGETTTVPNSDAMIVLTLPCEEDNVTTTVVSVPVACGAGEDAVEIAWLAGLEGVLEVGTAVTKPGAVDTKDWL